MPSTKAESMNVALIVAPARSPVSAHSRKALWRDFVHHAHFAGLAKRIFVLAKVLLGERVDVRVGAFVRYPRYGSAHLHIAIGVVGIHDRERDGRTFAHVARLHPAFRGVDTEPAVLAIEPYGRHLRGTVGHHRRKVRKGLLLFEKITVVFGIGCHGALSSRGAG